MSYRLGLGLGLGLRLGVRVGAFTDRHCVKVFCVIQADPFAYIFGMHAGSFRSFEMFTSKAVTIKIVTKMSTTDGRKGKEVRRLRERDYHCILI